SLVVHQDYHHLWLPHIHVSMESLSESFEMVEFKVDGAAVFYLTTAIPGETLERAIRYQFSREEKLDLMDGALARVPRELSYIMRLTRALLIGQLVGLNAAKREFDSIVSEFGADLETDRQWMQNRDALAGWLKAPPEWVERSGE
ncbi:MAG: hypothetical protein KF861_18545, partial [Planctomycetaceae bacterium]|nr:hypothetical protein [Planctomycetaceae bacterium]